MKYLILFSFFIIFSCSGGKKVYMCGDHKCIDKKEFNEYFAKNLSIEIDLKNKKNKDKSIDLVKLNTEKKDIKISQDKNKNKKREAKKLAKIKAKEEKKNKKLILKQRKIMESKKAKLIKNQRKVKKSKINVKDKITSVKNKEIINVKKIGNNSICIDIDNCDIDKISESLIKKGTNKEFPDITLR